MIKQNFKLTDAKIKQNFLDAMKNEDYVPELKFSWSNWGFGLENLENAFKRIKQVGINYIELHGNHYTKDLGYSIKEVNSLKKRYNIGVSGICGMFSQDNDLSSNSALSRQRAIDYIKRELEIINEVGGEYLLIVDVAGW